MSNNGYPAGQGSSRGHSNDNGEDRHGGGRGRRSDRPPRASSRHVGEDRAAYRSHPYPTYGREAYYSPHRMTARDRSAARLLNEIEGMQAAVTIVIVPYLYFNVGNGVDSRDWAYPDQPRDRGGSRDPNGSREPATGYGTDVRDWAYGDRPRESGGSRDPNWFGVSSAQTLSGITARADPVSRTI